jgi:hypothetical protein
MPHASLLTKMNDTKARRRRTFKWTAEIWPGFRETGVVCSADEILSFFGFVVNGKRNGL